MLSMGMDESYNAIHTVFGVKRIPSPWIGLRIRGDQEGLWTASVIFWRADSKNFWRSNGWFG